MQTDMTLTISVAGVFLNFLNLVDILYPKISESGLKGYMTFLLI